LTAARGGAFAIDERKVKRDARFDGKWVLRTDTDLPSEEQTRLFSSRSR